VLGAAIQRLEAQFPWLLERLGRRPDIELPAFLVSISLHGLLLVGLAFAGYQVHHEIQREFKSEVVDNLISTDSTYQDLDQSADPPASEPVAGSFAPNLAPTITSAPSIAGGISVSALSEDSSRVQPMELAQLDVRRATEVVVPTATMLAQAVSIRGNGAEFVGGVEGAVDRIAVEILRRLEKGRTLVAWAFDASGSLQAERQRIARHIETIYSHITQLDESQLSADNALLTMVVAFGHDRKTLLPKPTADRSEITEAIAAVPLDKTGVETTFTTVGEVVNRWGHYRDAQNRIYHMMVIVVTDEVGDDQEQLEDVIALAKRAKVSVYILGSEALFGRVDGYVDYVDPTTKHVFHGVRVDQGPESVMLEQIRLPFWYGGPQYDMIEAGFGPYALSRLAAATGGIYFVTRFDTHRMGFDPARMREYKPDWVSRNEYLKQVERLPLRQAVLSAAQITRQKLPGMPGLSFPPVDTPQFKEVMTANQAIAERTAYTVDEALGPINMVARLRNRETSRRWQAHYDLIRGRLLAMKVRCYEYNWACARMKKDTPKFTNSKSNAWRLVPDKQIQYSEKAVTAGHEAEALLQRVVEEHAATPWALLAQRELSNPLGFRWVETYVPPPRRHDNDSGKRKKQTPSPGKPPEMPKL
jgi:von Willebrand factor type A domain